MAENNLYEPLATLPFMNPTLDVEDRVQDLLQRLTPEEKFMLCGGKGMWSTTPIKRLGIPQFKMTDGPHGVGALGSWFKKMTYFPSAICRAATWNPALSGKFGEALAREVRSIGYQMILAPGVNIDRSPLCGRTFEYQTEDPYLNRQLVTALVRGVQSLRVAACVKHFACNNQETWRRKVNARVEERALQEIYLPGFKAAVTEADAWSLMSCYNRLNGFFGCENEDLLVKRLKDAWGFRGFVVSDWFAAANAESTASCVKGGLGLEMPGIGRGRKYSVKALQSAFGAGEFPMEALDRNLKGLLRVMFLTGIFDDPKNLPRGERNTREHQQIALEIAREGMVLLKNEGNTLPLNIKEVKSIAVLGPNAKRKSGLGGGSSMVRPKYEITALKGIKRFCKGKVKIVKKPEEADVVILVVGLSHKFFKSQDSEGRDKKTLTLPRDQVTLIHDTIAKNPRTIVILMNGSPLSMNEWLDKVPAVVEGWYWGMEGGTALAEILFGDVCPSGKLPLTFPKRLEDSPAHSSQRSFPGEMTKEGPTVYYDEGIFVGYRHFDAKQIEPLFPFGFGLSYTTFDLANVTISSPQVSANKSLQVSVDVTNSGRLTGAEVIQLYLTDQDASLPRPPKELKGFQKVWLEPGHSKTFKLEIAPEDLAFFDDKKGKWAIEKGTFEAKVGLSSRDIRGKASFDYTG